MKRLISLTAIFMLSTVPGVFIFSLSTGFHTGDLQCYRSDVLEKDVRVIQKKTGRVYDYRVNSFEVCKGLLTLSEGRKVVFKDSVGNCDLFVLRVYK